MCASTLSTLPEPEALSSRSPEAPPGSFSESAPGMGPRAANDGSAAAAAGAAHRRGLARFLTQLINPLRSLVEGGGVAPGTISQGLPSRPEPVGLRGEMAVFADEADSSTRDLAANHVTYQQFRAFFEVVRRTSLLREARRRPDYARRVSLFAIGALLNMEQQIDVRSERGRALVHLCLELFVQTHGSIEQFTAALADYVAEPDASRFIRAGARCYDCYCQADIAGLTTTFGETFGIFEPFDKTLGGRVMVGILFTDIVNSTELTAALGDDLAQQVVDHHERQVSMLLLRHGGRRVKHLGDGFMLSFSRAERMVAFATALMDTHRVVRARMNLPRYDIRIGGHYGEAIARGGDFFGATVQLAARIADTAAPGEARFRTDLVGRACRLFDDYGFVGAYQLRGFDRTMCLSGYSA